MKAKVSHTEKTIEINGKKISMIHETEISKIEWKKHNSPYVWKKILQQSQYNSINIEWINHNSLRTAGSIIFGNKYMSYLLNSYFLIKCKT